MALRTVTAVLGCSYYPDGPPEFIGVSVLGEGFASAKLELLLTPDGHRLYMAGMQKTPSPLSYKAHNTKAEFPDINTRVISGNPANPDSVAITVLTPVGARKAREDFADKLKPVKLGALSLP